MAYVPKFLQFRTVERLLDLVYPANANVDASVDLRGALYVVPTNYASTSDTYLNSFATAHEFIADGDPPRRLVTMNGFNPSTTETLYLQVHDGEPVAGRGPVQAFLLPPLASFSWTPPSRATYTMMYVLPSSTPGFYTELVGTHNTWVRVDLDSVT